MPVAGDIVRASDNPPPLFADKNATESVTSSTVLQDDDDLLVTVEADTVYEVCMMLRYDGATAGDLKIQFSGPSGATLKSCVHHLDAAAASTSDNRLTYVDNLLSGSGSLGALGAGTEATCLLTARLVVAGTAGTFRLQWAQITSSGTATRLFDGSFLRLLKVG